MGATSLSTAVALAHDLDELLFWISATVRSEQRGRVCARGLEARVTGQQHDQLRAEGAPVRAFARHGFRRSRERDSPERVPHSQSE